MIDFIDTAIKGRAYFESMGPEYPVRNLGYILMCLIAMRTRSEWFHRAFVAAGIVYELSWIYRLYDILD